MSPRVNSVSDSPAHDDPGDRALSLDQNRSYDVAPVLGGVELLSAIYRRHRFAPHSQPAAVIGVVEQGRAVVFGAGETLILEQGGVLVIPPHVLHHAYSIGDAEWHYRAMYLTGAQIAELAPDSRLGHGVLGTRPTVLRATDLASRVLAVQESLRTQRSAGDETVRAELRTLLHILDLHAAESVDTSVDSQRAAVGVARVRRLLDEDPLPKRSLSEMAIVAGLSRFSFAHAFSRAYGIPPHAYAVQRRVMAVRDLLMTGELVSRAAHHVGFADQSHLTRRFIAVVGVTPGEFRRAWLRM